MKIDFFHKDIQMDLRMLPVIVFVLCPGMSHEKQDENSAMLFGI